MEDNAWFVPAIFGLALLALIGTFGAYMISEGLKARRNRRYKSLDDHRAANAANRGPNAR